MKPYINTIQHRLLTYISLLLGIITMHSCSDIIDVIGGDNTISEGEEVRFTTLVPDHAPSTRSAKDEWQEGIKAYKPINREYLLTVSMYREKEKTPHGSTTFLPSVTDGTTPANYDGTLQLKEGATPLYWQDNVSRWGFTAEANSSPLSPEQDSQQKWLGMDHIKGYSYLPIWLDGDDKEKDDVNKINYRTAKEWYEDNKLSQQLSGLMVEGETGESFKKIPLYMRHQRAWITVILKADDGVSREQLYYKGGKNNISASITSYDYDETNEELRITAPWEQGETIEYTKDKNGEACTDSTTRFDAIVMPHHYKAEQKIAEVSLSGQKFSFAPANDYNYEASLNPANENYDSAVEAMKVYDLKAGQHLTITATLSRKSRMVLITAWVEDWTEVATSTVCDDYGQEGDPITLNSKQELIVFLSSSETNKAGMVGIIGPQTMNLDYEGIWYIKYDLNATLNLAGATLSTSKRRFSNIAQSGTITNGTVRLVDNATVDATIALNNNGTIERLNVTTTGNTEEKGRATLAGVVEVNRGTIFRCTSDIPVCYSGTPEDANTIYIGGIAARNIYNESNRNVMPIIDDCTVTASVRNGSGSNNVKGGGIVGLTAGRVTNNTFTYGMTISQNPDNFKNILADTDGDANAVRAYNNAWPTIALNSINKDEATNVNIWSSRFNAVIDNQEELALLLTEQYNKPDCSYRISDSFTVNSETWTYAVQDDNLELVGEHRNGNMVFSLDGNDCTITLTGTPDQEHSTVTYWSKAPNDGDRTVVTTAPMLFTNIMGEVKNLVLYLEKPIVAHPGIAENQTAYSGADAIAPLGYAVKGSNARLSNIRVTGADDTYVQSATPAGLVVYAYDDATVEDCKLDVSVKMWLPYNSNKTKDARNYAGGIVACAGKATITRCQYNGKLMPANESSDIEKCYYGGIVGGTIRKVVVNNEYIPQLTITDCSSWWDTGKDNEQRKGGIIGFTAYISATSSNDFYNGMAKGNEGNWWTAESKGTGYRINTVTEKDAIGAKNSITPIWTAE